MPNQKTPTDRSQSARSAAYAALFAICVMIATKSQAQTPDALALSPPINHETGRIEEVLTAEDKGFQYRAYVVRWRAMQIVVATSPGEQYATGDPLDFVVYRTDVSGRKVLRFQASQSSSIYDAEDESANASASITLGTAPVEGTLSADLAGYTFQAYFVVWHDKRVAVVDSQLQSLKATGDKLDFRVIHSGLGANQRLSFSM